MLNCAKPPSKASSFRRWTKPRRQGQKERLRRANEAYPDKKYLVLEVAFLLKGKDENFEVEYMPSKGLAEEVELQLSQH